MNTLQHRLAEALRKCLNYSSVSLLPLEARQEAREALREHDSSGDSSQPTIDLSALRELLGDMCRYNNGEVEVFTDWCERLEAALNAGGKP
jgi:hypothetical protein